MKSFPLFALLTLPLHAQEPAPLAVLHHFGVTDAEVLEVAEGGHPRRLTVAIEGTLYTLEFGRVRDLSGIQVLASGAAGEQVVPCPPVEALRGTVREMQGSVVYGTRCQGRYHLRIHLGETEWDLHPLPTALRRGNQHVLYRVRDAATSPGSCGCGQEHARALSTGAPRPTAAKRPGHTQGHRNTGSAPRTGNGPGISMSTVTHVAEVGLDLDYELYVDQQMSVQDTVEYALAFYETGNAFYYHEAIHHHVSAIVVRTSPLYPQVPTGSFNEMVAVLNAVVAQWQTHHTNLNYDAVQLLSKKVATMSPGFETTGIAFTPQPTAPLCNMFAVSRLVFSQANWPALIAHELGHNWSLGHCNGDTDCAIMFSSAGNGPGGNSAFGASSSAALALALQNVTCTTPAVQSDTENDGSHCGASMIGNEPIVGSNYELRMYHFNPDPFNQFSFHFLILGFSETSWNGIPLPLELSPIQVPGCYLYTGMDIVIPMQPYGQNPTQEFVAHLPLPNQVELAGFVFYNQAFTVRQPGTFQNSLWTDLLRSTLGHF